MIMDPETLKTIGYVVGAAAGGVGAGAAAVKKWPFWKKNGSGNKNGDGKIKCSDPECHDLVIITAEKVETLEEGQSEIFKKLDNMPEKIVKLLKDTKGLLS